MDFPAHSKKSIILMKFHAPMIFDRHLRSLRQKKICFDRDHPLHHLVHEILDERLSFLKRSFDSTLIMGNYLPQDAKLNTSIRIQSQLNSLEADTDFLPFKDNTFDLIISYFDLHTINDIPGVLSQIHHCLQPDGLFLGFFLGGQSLIELRQTVQSAEIALKNGASPRVAPMVSLYDCAALLQRAGFSLPVADHEIITLEYETPKDILDDLKKIGLSNCLVQQHRGLMGKDLYQRIQETYTDLFKQENNKIPCTFDLVFLSGWKPAPTQQIPLKPGSGKISLQNIL